MKNIFLAILLITSFSYSKAQGYDSYAIFTATDWIDGVRIAAVKSEAIGSEHVIIVNGITMKSQSQLSAALEGIYANSIIDYNILDNEQVKQGYKKLQGWNGALLVILDNKGHKRFSKNIKQFEKRSSTNNPKQP